MPFCSPGFAASARPPPRASWRDASIARKGRPPSRAANARPASRFAQGRALDVVEIDGATYRKIDDARAIIENLSYRPARDRFKIYIIDEAHQLTDQAFNALLKTLEEPPAARQVHPGDDRSRRRCPRRSCRGCSATTSGASRSTTILARLKELAAREGDRGRGGGAAPARARGRRQHARRRADARDRDRRARPQGDRERGRGVAGRRRAAARVFELAEAILNKDAAAALAHVRELHRRGANLESLGRDLLEDAAQSRGREAARRRRLQVRSPICPITRRPN